MSDRAGAKKAATQSRGGGPLLAVKNVSVHFGGIVALDNVSFDLPEGMLLGLIGPNGAGKTTLFNCLSRLYTPAKGDILFDGQSILDKPAAPHRRHRHRAHLPESRAVPAACPSSTMCGSAAIAQSRSDFLSDALRLPWVRRQEEALAESA